MALLENALGRGVRALLHCWRAAHQKATQVLPDGRVYVESCPAYLNTVSGMTRYAASIAWRAARSLVGWVEVGVAEAVALGAALRELPAGKRRGGRHLLLEPWQAHALESAAQAGAPAAPSLGRGVALPLPPEVAGLQRAHRRTVAVCCPAHQDRHPSLVLWRNGGAMCMTCGWRAAWRVHREHLLLYSAGEGRPADALVQRVSTTNTPSPVEGVPVGGMVATRSRAAQHVSATLRAWPDEHGRWHLARSRGRVAPGGVLGALQSAEQRSAGRAATEQAQVAAVCGEGVPGRGLVPDALLSVSCMSRPDWRTPWSARLQRWMLLDLDGVRGLDGCAGLGAALLQAAQADPEVGDRVAVVRTGPEGVQVWVALAEPRFDPATWCRLPQVRRWHAALGERLLAVAHRLGASGGCSDSSACAAGRFGRRPGWRVLGGAAYRAHLLAVCG